MSDEMKMELGEPYFFSIRVGMYSQQTTEFVEAAHKQLVKVLLKKFKKKSFLKKYFYDPENQEEIAKEKQTYAKENKIYLPFNCEVYYPTSMPPMDSLIPFLHISLNSGVAYRESRRMLAKLFHDWRLSVRPIGSITWLVDGSGADAGLQTEDGWDGSRLVREDWLSRLETNDSTELSYWRHHLPVKRGSRRDVTIEWIKPYKSIQDGGCWVMSLQPYQVQLTSEEVSASYEWGMTYANGMTQDKVRVRIEEYCVCQILRQRIPTYAGKAIPCKSLTRMQTVCLAMRNPEDDAAYAGICCPQHIRYPGLLPKAETTTDGAGKEEDHLNPAQTTEEKETNCKDDEEAVSNDGGMLTGEDNDPTWIPSVDTSGTEDSTYILQSPPPYFGQAFSHETEEETIPALSSYPAAVLEKRAEVLGEYRQIIRKVDKMQKDFIQRSLNFDRTMKQMGNRKLDAFIEKLNAERRKAEYKRYKKQNTKSVVVKTIPEALEDLVAQFSRRLEAHRRKMERVMVRFGSAWWRHSHWFLPNRPEREHAEDLKARVESWQLDRPWLKRLPHLMNQWRQQTPGHWKTWALPGAMGKTIERDILQNLFTFTPEATKAKYPNSCLPVQTTGGHVTYQQVKEIFYYDRLRNNREIQEEASGDREPPQAGEDPGTEMAPIEHQTVLDEYNKVLIPGGEETEDYSSPRPSCIRYYSESIGDPVMVQAMEDLRKELSGNDPENENHPTIDYYPCTDMESLTGSSIDEGYTCRRVPRDELIFLPMEVCVPYIRDGTKDNYWIQDGHRNKQEDPRIRYYDFNEKPRSYNFTNNEGDEDGGPPTRKDCFSKIRERQHQKRQRMMDLYDNFANYRECTRLEFDMMAPYETNRDRIPALGPRVMQKYRYEGVLSQDLTENNDSERSRSPLARANRKGERKYLQNSADSDWEGGMEDTCLWDKPDTLSTGQGMTFTSLSDWGPEETVEGERKWRRTPGAERLRDRSPDTWQKTLDRAASRKRNRSLALQQLDNPNHDGTYGDLADLMNEIRQNHEEEEDWDNCWEQDHEQQTPAGLPSTSKPVNLLDTLEPKDTSEPIEEEDTCEGPPMKRNKDEETDRHHAQSPLELLEFKDLNRCLDLPLHLPRHYEYDFDPPRKYEYTINTLNSKTQVDIDKVVRNMSTSSPCPIPQDPYSESTETFRAWCDSLVPSSPGVSVPFDDATLNDHVDFPGTPLEIPGTPIYESVDLLCSVNEIELGEDEAWMDEWMEELSEIKDDEELEGEGTKGDGLMLFPLELPETLEKKEASNHGITYSQEEIQEYYEALLNKKLENTEIPEQSETLYSPPNSVINPDHIISQLLHVNSPVEDIPVEDQVYFRIDMSDVSDEGLMNVSYDWMRLWATEVAKGELTKVEQRQRLNDLFCESMKQLCEQEKKQEKSLTEAKIQLTVDGIKTLRVLNEEVESVDSGCASEEATNQNTVGESVATSREPSPVPILLIYPTEDCSEDHTHEQMQRYYYRILKSIDKEAIYGSLERLTAPDESDSDLEIPGDAGNYKTSSSGSLKATFDILFKLPEGYSTNRSLVRKRWAKKRRQMLSDDHFPEGYGREDMDRAFRDRLIELYQTEILLQISRSYDQYLTTTSEVCPLSEFIRLDVTRSLEGTEQHPPSSLTKTEQAQALNPEVHHEGQTYLPDYDSLVMSYKIYPGTYRGCIEKDTEIPDDPVILQAIIQKYLQEIQEDENDRRQYERRSLKHQRPTPAPKYIWDKYGEIWVGPPPVFGLDEEDHNPGDSDDVSWNGFEGSCKNCRRYNFHKFGASNTICHGCQSLRKNPRYVEQHVIRKDALSRYYDVYQEIFYEDSDVGNPTGLSDMEPLVYRNRRDCKQYQLKQQRKGNKKECHACKEIEGFHGLHRNYRRCEVCLEYRRNPTTIKPGKKVVEEEPVCYPEVYLDIAKPTPQSFVWEIKAGEREGLVCRLDKTGELWTGPPEPPEDNSYRSWRHYVDKGLYNSDDDSVGILPSHCRTCRAVGFHHFAAEETWCIHCRRFRTNYEYDAQCEELENLTGSELEPSGWSSMEPLTYTMLRMTRLLRHVHDPKESSHYDKYNRGCAHCSSDLFHDKGRFYKYCIQCRQFARNPYAREEIQQSIEGVQSLLESEPEQQETTYGPLYVPIHGEPPESRSRGVDENFQDNKRMNYYHSKEELSDEAWHCLSLLGLDRKLWKRLAHDEQTSTKSESTASNEDQGSDEDDDSSTDDNPHCSDLRSFRLRLPPKSQLVSNCSTNEILLVLRPSQTDDAHGTAVCVSVYTTLSILGVAYGLAVLMKVIMWLIGK